MFQNLFSRLDVLDYKELTLSANLAKKDLNRYRWNHGNKPQSGEQESETKQTDILLRPMAIKTYLLTVKSR